MDRGEALEVSTPSWELTVNWWLPGEGELVFFRDVVPRSTVTRVHTGNRKLGGEAVVGIEELE